jgi:NADH pyrophosphatase NudC (nudix superfamily)
VTAAYECRLESDSLTLEEEELANVEWFTPEAVSDLATQPHVAPILADAGLFN